ncbi:molybdopterin-dependent oxidoreductase [Phaeobacter sp.]|uniref:molybdopterin-dependent oxidoreductase n=1 Tax=Phaeobacter sp. TaxID=1902409 RepID=UPI0025FA1052|nr:molybdopterin-dependent oxidoreductase [Phaeobacter sp.]
MFRFFLTALTCVTLTATPIAVPVAAKDLGVPQAEVVLTVTNSDVTNADGVAVLDLAMLEQLGRRSFETTTIWTDGAQRFDGVSLATLVDQLGLHGAALRATAINDYSVTIPLEDVSRDGAMIAYRMNGAPMSVRDKGPLWIVYPYDEDPRFQTEVIYSRSIWQLDRIEVID